MTPADRQRLRGLLEAATKGRWFWTTLEFDDFASAFPEGNAVEVATFGPSCLRASQ